MNSEHRPKHYHRGGVPIAAPVPYAASSARLSCNGLEALGHFLRGEGQKSPTVSMVDEDHAAEFAGLVRNGMESRLAQAMY